MAIFLLYPKIYGQEVTRSIITSPARALEGEELLAKRKQKVESLQRAKALLHRAKMSLKKVPLAKKSIRKRLQKAIRQLKVKIATKQLQVQKITEDIIIKGHPGLVL